MTAIGVLALQGAFDAHLARLRDVGLSAKAVRSPRDLDALDGLVLPGGESSTQLGLIECFGLGPGLDAFVRSGRPVLATCAGLILAARAVRNPAQRSFGWIELSVARNAWGSQAESFVANADGSALPLVFIRAPRIVEMGRQVEVLATYEKEAVLVRQGTILAATFHPELSSDSTVHRLAFANCP